MDFSIEISLGRESDRQLKDGSAIENQTIYAYGATDGRLASVGNGVESFTYGYLANSNLISTVTGPAHTVTNTYEATRDVLASKENEVGSTLVSGYSYTVNFIGARPVGGKQVRDRVVGGGSSRREAAGEIHQAEGAAEAEPMHLSKTDL